MDTLFNVNTQQDGIERLYVGFTFNVFPKVLSRKTENSYTGGMSYFVLKVNYKWIVFCAFYEYILNVVKNKGIEFYTSMYC